MGEHDDDNEDIISQRRNGNNHKYRDIYIEIEKVAKNIRRQ